jgi:hypothetical protein
MNLKETADKLFEDSKGTPIRGLSAISEAEKYLQQAYEGLYFFELIQNVRDSNKEIIQDGEIYIELKENFLSISNTGSEFSAKGFQISFESIIRGHTPRIIYDTLKNRLTNKNKPWLGHIQWNITSEL